MRPPRNSAPACRYAHLIRRFTHLLIVHCASTLRCRELTRGQGAFTAEAVRVFVRKLVTEGQIPAAAGEELLALTPVTYVGYAEELARGVRSHRA